MSFNLNAGIPLGINQPDLVNTLARSDQARMRRGEEAQQNALRSFLRDNGDAIYQGDQAALGQYAQFDPQAAFGMRVQQRGLEMQEERLRLARAAGARAAASAKLTREQLAQSQAEYNLMRQAAMARATDPEAFAEYLKQPEFAGRGVTAENFDVWMATAEGAAGELFPNLQRLQPSVPDNQTERDIALMMELGHSRDTAIEALKVNVVSRDPVTGEAVILNRITGQPVGGLEPATPTGNQPTPSAETPVPEANLSVIPENGADYRGALGAEGAVTGLVNGIVDFAIGQRPFEEQGRARTALNNVRTRTLTTLATVTVPGRPSNYVMEMFNQNVVQPSVLSGAGGALDTAEQTLSFLRGMEQENENILQSRVSATARSEAQANLQRLRGLRQDYEILVRNLAPAGAGNVDPADIQLMNDLLGQ